MKHLCHCVAGKTPEDSAAVRLQEKALNRFPESWPTVSDDTRGEKSTFQKSSKGRKGKQARKSKKHQDQSGTSLPPAPFVLTNNQLDEVARRAKQVLVPAGDSFYPGPIFSHLSRLNSHEWKEVLHKLLNVMFWLVYLALQNTIYHFCSGQGC